MQNQLSGNPFLTIKRTDHVGRFECVAQDGLWEGKHSYGAWNVYCDHGSNEPLRGLWLIQNRTKDKFHSIRLAYLDSRQLFQFFFAFVLSHLPTVHCQYCVHSKTYQHCGPSALAKATTLTPMLESSFTTSMPTPEEHKLFNTE
jgi:hypothetical protein